LSERWITHRGLRLCVDDLGAGPVVLLAHGMWCDAGMFARLSADLARDHRVLVPDLRGHGRSEVPASAWTIADLSDDLVAILKQLDVSKLTLAGFSMGGMAAADFALKYSARLTGLALIGTSAAAEELVRVAEIKALARIIEIAGTPKFLAREASRSAFSAEFRRSNPAEVTRFESVVRSMHKPALVQALRAVASRPSLLERLGEVQTPTLIISGTADKVLRPRWSKAMHRRLPHSRLVGYPGVGHNVPTERPIEVAALLRGLESGTLPWDR
jgi:pimeloyl-ACP methyl ester carboxylesterase